MPSEALKVVIEYDGCYYHSGGHSGHSVAYQMAHDREKIQSGVIGCRQRSYTHLEELTFSSGYEDR